MPQTLLAILGLMVTVLLSFSTQREVVSSQREMIANELEVMGTGIALEAMETIRTRAFDNATLDATEVVTKGNFSFPFSDGNKCRVFHDGSGVKCEDLDDFHNMLEATLEFEVSETESLPFHVNAEVHYVERNSEGDFVRVNHKTYQKEVLVTVQDAVSEGRRPYLTKPIHLSRTFSYNFGLDGSTGGGGGGVVQDEDETEFSNYTDWFLWRIEDDDIREDYAEVAQDYADSFGDHKKYKQQKKRFEDLAQAITEQNENKIRQGIRKNKTVQNFLQREWKEANEDNGNS